jgi:hypothetical protein
VEKAPTEEWEKIDIAQNYTERLPSEEEVSKMNEDELRTLCKMLLTKNTSVELKKADNEWFMWMMKKFWY